MAAANRRQLTQAEYAKHRGVSQPLIARYIKQGRMNGAFRKSGGRYLIDATIADALLDKNNTGMAVGRPTKKKQKAHGSLFEAQVKSAWLKTMLLKLQYDRETGTLVPRVEMEAHAAKVGTLLRVHLEALPSKLAVAVAGLTSPGQVAKLLEKEIKSILQDISEELSKVEF